MKILAPILGALLIVLSSTFLLIRYIKSRNTQTKEIEGGNESASDDSESSPSQQTNGDLNEEAEKDANVQTEVGVQDNHDDITRDDRQGKQSELLDKIPEDLVIHPMKTGNESFTRSMIKELEIHEMVKDLQTEVENKRIFYRQ